MEFATIITNFPKFSEVFINIHIKDNTKLLSPRTKQSFGDFKSLNNGNDSFARFKGN